MKIHLMPGLLAAALLTACGGGGQSSPPAAAATAPVTYNFIAPKAGVQLVFANTLVDNLNNTLTRTVIENVTAVNPDGSFTSASRDLSNNISTSGGTDQTFYPTTYNYNSAAQALNWTVTPYSGAAFDCVATPHAGGAPAFLAFGQTWSFSFTEICGGSSSVSFNQIGTFVGIESITVPAGTFKAYKIQSLTTLTTPAGTNITEAITQWRTAQGTDARNLKLVINYSYSGTAPAPGSLVSATTELQSFQ